MLQPEWKSTKQSVHYLNSNFNYDKKAGILYLPFFASKKIILKFLVIMRIQNISTNNSNYYKPSFTEINRQVWTKSYNVKHRNTSYFFRPSLEKCKEFYAYLSKVFRNVDKVNVYSYGCSIGYEAYSFIMGMFCSGKEKNPEKFMPVMAKDYDKKIIEYAKENILPLSNYEIHKLRQLYSFDLDRLKDVIDTNFYIKYKTRELYAFELSTNPSTYVKPTDKLTNNVNFSVADIRKDYENIEPENSVVMACNFWPYMRPKDRRQLAENLYNHLGKNSYVKIDDFDNDALFNKSTASLLLGVGFKPTPVENLFRR